MSSLAITHYDALDWHVPVSSRDEIDWDHVPGADEPGRKFLVEGAGGFYVQAVRIPPNFDAPMHSHSHAEVFMVVEGSCTFRGGADASTMRPFDATVVEAGSDYGFTSGPDGVTFVVTRLGEATFHGQEA